MLYGPSAGESRKNGETDERYPSRSDGSVVALLVRINGAWKPRCESGADATAACQSLMLTSEKPWPGPVIFQPNMPIGVDVPHPATALQGVDRGLWHRVRVH